MQDVAVRDSKDVLPTFSMTPRTFEEALKFAELMSKSDLVPKDFKDKPGNILVAIQKGQEVGLSPMAALETIAVINGRASLWGDGLLGIVQGSAVYEWIDESQCSERAGVCVVKRKGEQPYTATFTLEDAKRAGLLGKPGPWTQYTKRMLQLRARGFALRDKFADVLKGLVAAEEAMDAVTILPAESDQPKASSLKEKLQAQLEPPTQPTTSDTYMSPPSKPPATVGQQERQEDGVGGPLLVNQAVMDAKHAQQESHTVAYLAGDAPQPAPTSAADFCKKRAEETDDLFVEGFLVNWTPYEGKKPNQKGAKPGYISVDDGQNTMLLKGIKYFDPALDEEIRVNGLKRVYYKTDSYKGRTQYNAIRIESLDAPQ